MRHGIDQSLLPGEGRILETFAKKEIMQNRALANVLFDPTDRFIDQSYQRRFKTDAFNYGQRATVLPVRALVFDEVNPCARMPAARISGEQQHGGHVGTR